MNEKHSRTQYLICTAAGGAYGVYALAASGGGR
jgi:hypothetical protein